MHTADTRTSVPAVNESTRLLILLNPGSTSRNYLIGIARAAERMGILAGALELEPIWRQIAAPGADAAAVRQAAARQVGALCAERGVTHVLGYTHNGVFDFGLFPDPLSGAIPVGLFPSLGLTHILLWTDHPHWAAQGSALEPQVARVLAHPSHLHIVKSPAAAAELTSLCRWPRVLATTMGEDYEALAPVQGVAPIHDVVLIQSDAAPLSESISRFLTDPDPDPRDIMGALRHPTMSAVAHMLAESEPSPTPESRAAIEAFAGALIEMRLDAMLTPWWRIAQALIPEHVAAVNWLHADIRRWVRFTAALNTLVGWRRRFWPAWLARHVDVGLYGSNSGPMGIKPPPDGDRWVDYTRQPEIYARGRFVLNINAGHDEEGLTHKPFQIAASGAACLHHDSAGLADAFECEREIIPFTRARELLDAIRTLGADHDRRRSLADAMRSRARRDHSWDRFLERAIVASSKATAHSHVESSS